MVNAADGLRHKRGDADDRYFWSVGLRNGVGGDYFLDCGFLDSLVSDFAKDGVGNSGKNPFRAMGMQNFRGGFECTGGFGHVIDQEDIAPFDITNHVHCFDVGGGDAVFGDDREFRAEGIGVSAGHFDAADIRGYNGQIRGVWMALAKMADKCGFGIKVIDGDVEKALDLRGVEIHGEDPVYAGGGEQVGHEFGGNGHAGLVFAVLAGVAEKGHYRGDSAGAGAACGIHHDEQLHDVVIGGRTTGLNEKDIFIADVFIDFHERFAVGKRGDLDVGEGLIEVGSDFFRECPVGCAADDLHNWWAGRRIVDSEFPGGNTFPVPRRAGSG